MNEPAVAVPAGKVADEQSLQARSEARARRSDFRQNNLVGYLFISPWLIAFPLFTFIPISISLLLAFTDYDLLSGKWNFIGLDNFQRMFFDDIRYGRSVVATLRYVIAAVPLRLAFALGVAMLLNTKRRGVYWYRAAYIDGCSKIGIFHRIIVPQIQPAIVTATIFSFYWSWEEFLAPLIYLTNPNLYTISVALRNFSDPGGITNWGAMFAMLSLSLMPVFLIFVFFQRYLVEGIATTGLKG
jgi:ABC-type glycerol-3-phosphate transport system permease component